MTEELKAKARRTGRRSFRVVTSIVSRKWSPKIDRSWRAP